MRRCAGKARRTGDRCKRAAHRDFDRCMTHAGQIRMEQVLARRMAGASLRLAVAVAKNYLGLAPLWRADHLAMINLEALVRRRDYAGAWEMFTSWSGERQELVDQWSTLEILRRLAK